MNSQRVFITYVVPCYNVENYINRCLDSLRCQKIDADPTGREIEYIFVNDGSSDSTLSILEGFASKDSRALVINQDNQGVSTARNAGLKAAHGEYVFFLDSDDFLTDDASQILYDVCKENAPDIIVPNAFFVDEGHWEEKREWNVCKGIKSGVYDTIEFAHSVKGLPISFKAYRRSLLIENAIFYDEELKVGEVYAFFIHAMTFSRKIAYTDKRVMNYFVRRGSVMRTLDLKRDSTIITTMHRIDEYARNQMPELIDISSYIRSTYGIVNMFSIDHYLELSSFTPEIVEVLKTIKKDKIYKNLQRFYLFRMPNTYKGRIYCSLLYFFPVSFSYRVIKSLKKVKYYC